MESGQPCDGNQLNDPVFQDVWYFQGFKDKGIIFSTIFWFSLLPYTATLSTVHLRANACDVSQTERQ
jgi:hypothetical protein